MNIAFYIDHTVLKAETTVADIEKLCSEAIEYQFAAVCVPPPFIALAKKLLANSSVKTATVIGFPFGYSSTNAKLEETILAIQDGADELDVVVNLIEIKKGNWDHLQNEINILTQFIHDKNKIIKIIVESGVLTHDELVQCCKILAPLKIDFMKTSTGYAKVGATIDAVKTMRENLPSEIKIKASGGIRDYQFAAELISAGANRLGCSASVAIANGEKKSGNIGDY